MSRELFQTGREPRILIGNVAGDLVIRPWMRLEVEAQGSFSHNSKEDALLFEADGDLVLKVPEGAQLHVQSVHGDAVIKSVRGACELGEVQGDTVLSNLGAARVEKVQGDLVARNLSGVLSAGTVQGDAVLRGVDEMVQLSEVRGDVVAQYVNGSLNLDEVHGDITAAAINGDVTVGHGRRDLNVREIGGLLQAKDIAGDVRLRGGLRAGQHVLAAQGDIVVRWPVQMPLVVSAQGAEVRNQLPLQDIEKSEEGFRGRLGDGGAELALHAGGKVILKEAELVRSKWSEGMEAMFESDFFSELGSLGAQIAGEVNKEVGKIAAEIETNLAANLQGLGAQFSQKANEAASKARSMAEEFAAQERQTGVGKTGRGGDKRPSEPGTAEEQLRILKMVEKGVITPEEANLLLEALEGN